MSFYFGQGARPGAESVKLFGEELVPVCAPGCMPDKPFTDPTQLADLVLLQNAHRPQGWHEWFESQGYQTEHSYHGPRFETFYMCIRAAQVGCGVALLPRFLVEEELADGKLIIPWPHALPSRDAYYLAYPEHAAEVPKIRVFVEWMLEQLDQPTPS
jgi:DNA-binding transcriptional LysR family regulator